jgi:hypothetical protein
MNIMFFKRDKPCDKGHPEFEISRDALLQLATSVIRLIMDPGSLSRFAPTIKKAPIRRFFTPQTPSGFNRRSLETHEITHFFMRITLNPTGS